MKYSLIILLIISALSCNDRSQIKVNFPKGNKILYWEFTGLESKRLVLYSLDEQKEYEIPLNNIDGFPHSAKFSMDGTKILIKDPNNIDGVHILDLVNSKWDFKILSPLNHLGERDYFFYNYLNDSTVAFSGQNNLFIIAMNTNQLLDRIEYKDTSHVWRIDLIPEKDILILNYYDTRKSLNDMATNIILYNYKSHNYSHYHKNTGRLYQWIPETNYLFMMDSVAVKFNFETGEEEPIIFDKISSIIYPSSKFINSTEIIILKEENDQYKNNFYLYNFADKSQNQLTKTKTEKTLMDIYFKQE